MSGVTEIFLEVKNNAQLYNIYVPIVHVNKFCDRWPYFMDIRRSFDRVVRGANYRTL